MNVIIEACTKYSGSAEERIINLTGDKVLGKVSARRMMSGQQR